MDETQLLEEIKKRLSVTGDYHDELLKGLASDVKCYLISAGVKEEIANSSVAVGCIARGVADLWNFGSGEGTFSELFKQRAIQLTFEEVVNVQTDSTV